jgi:putative ABC transport system permease protein
MLMFPRRTSLALLNVLASPTRAMVSISGVTFALLLIFVQLGFRHAVANTASIIFGKLKFDIILRSPEYLHLYEARTIDRRFLELAASHPEVETIDPFWITLTKWQSPDGMSINAMAMMAMPPGRQLLDVPELDAKLPLLDNPHAVLIDRATQEDFGPKSGLKFGDDDIGAKAELGQRQVTIVGHVLIGTGLATNGALMISDVGLGIRSPIDVKRQASMGLIRVKPGVDVDQAADKIRQWLVQQDEHALEKVIVMTRDEMIAWEHHRWLNETPIGIIFQVGVALAFLVGAAIVYMVLAQDVSNRLPEYATLKAMGYSQMYLAGVVLQQAWLLSIVGWIFSVILSDILYRITAVMAGIPIQSTAIRIAGVAVLSVFMCTVSGLLALRKLWKAEPASLF